jgi:hypothetical protein
MFLYLSHQLFKIPRKNEDGGRVARSENEILGGCAASPDTFGVVAYKSTDLKSWDGPHLVFSVLDGIWANPADGAWAPEVHGYRGRLYLLLTLHNNDKLLDEPVPVTHPIYQGKPATHHLRGTQIFVANSPDGPFRLLGKGSATPPDFMALDGTFYLNQSTQLSDSFAFVPFTVLAPSLSSEALQQALSTHI